MKQFYRDDKSIYSDRGDLICNQLSYDNSKYVDFMYDSDVSSLRKVDYLRNTILNDMLDIFKCNAMAFLGINQHDDCICLIYNYSIGVNIYDTKVCVNLPIVRPTNKTIFKYFDYTNYDFEATKRILTAYLKRTKFREIMELKEAAIALDNDLRPCTWLTAVGVDETSPAIRVYVRSLPPVAIPREYKGYKVIVTKTGAVKPV